MSEGGVTDTLKNFLQLNMPKVSKPHCSIPLISVRPALLLLARRLAGAQVGTAVQPAVVGPLRQGLPDVRSEVLVLYTRKLCLVIT